MEEMIVRRQLPHRERLGEVLTVLEKEPISLNMATFWAQPRFDAERAAVGCPIGHYVSRKKPRHLDLVPFNFLEQLKAPIAATATWKAYPNARWRHHTLHYSGPEVEAWGMTAACLYFQLRPYDVQRLFYPNGTNYVLEPPPKVVAERLARFLDTERAVVDAP